MRKICYIATLPERENQLIKTVGSLINQVDLIVISFNNYKKIPNWACESDRIEPHITYNEFGDAERYRYIKKDKHLAIFADDDLIFPDNYVKICEYYTKSYDDTIFSFHGRTLKQLPISNYYRDKEKVFHCLQNCIDNEIVDVIGTGVAFWLTDIFSFDFEKVITEKNMADILISVEAKKQGLTRMVCRHFADFLKYQDVKNTIYDTHKNNCEIQTNYINENYN